MKIIPIPLSFGVSESIYETNMGFKTADVNSAVLQFTGDIDPVGCVATLTMNNETNNANRVSTVLEQFDVEKNPFDYLLQEEIQSDGVWLGEITLKRNLITVCSQKFRFAIGSSLQQGVIGQLVKSKSLDELVMVIREDVMEHLGKNDLSVKGIEKYVNEVVAKLLLGETNRNLNEEERKLNEITRKTAFEVWSQAVSDLIDQGVIDQRVQAIIEEFQSTYSTSLFSLSQQLEQTNAQVDLLNRGLGETFATLTNLQTAYPTGDTKDHIVGADGHRYYWNDSAWADGGAYQAVEILDDSISIKSLNNDLLNSLYINGDVQLLNSKYFYSESNNLSFTDSTLVATPKATRQWSPISLNQSYHFDELTFEFMTQQFVLLGGNDTNYTVVGLGTNITTVFEFTADNFTSIKSATSGVVKANTGDFVNVKYINGVYYFKIKRVGETEFVDWFVIDKSTVSGGIGWNLNSNLGFIRYAATGNNIAKNIIGKVAKTPLELREKLKSLETTADKVLNSTVANVLTMGDLEINTDFNLSLSDKTYYGSIFSNKTFALAKIINTPSAISFKITHTTPTWVMIGGDASAYTMLGFGNSNSGTVVNGRIVDYNATANTYTLVVSSLAGELPVIGDTISIEYDSINAKYIVNKNGVLLWEILKSNYTSTSWDTPAFGIVKEKASVDSDIFSEFTIGADDIYNRVSNIEMDKKWFGKKWGVVGDSITYGTGTTKTYHQMISSVMGFDEVVNYGISGNEIATSGTHPNPIVTRYTTFDSDCDLITIFAGTNDFGFNVDIGTFDSRDNAKFYGALHNLCVGLYNNFPNARVAFLTPLKRDTEFTANTKGYVLKQYVDAIKEVCAYYGIPVLDLYSMSGICPTIASNKNTFVPDGVHPNIAGHAIFANTVRKFLESI